MAQGHNYYSIVNLSVSEDIVLWPLLKTRSAQTVYDLRKDLKSGKIIDTRYRYEGDVPGANDKNLLYVRKIPQLALAMDQETKLGSQS